MIIARHKQKPTNQLRIIGGQWRGRKLSFPDAPGLRPTSDRTRETLFNWLQNEIVDSRCLDLFSGSGALGFEALSRGASHVTFVESNKKVFQQIKHNCELLMAKNAEVIHLNALDYLHGAKNEAPFNIVFLDPPFQKNMLADTLLALQTRTLIDHSTKLYIEVEANILDASFLEDFNVLKEKKAGQVRYYLCHLL